MTDAIARSPRGWMNRFLDLVERIGNRLPDQVTIFASLAGLTLLVSWISASAGITAINPISGATIESSNLLTREGLLAALTRRSQRVNERPGCGLLAGVGCYVIAIVGATVVERHLSGGHPAPWLHDPLRAFISTTLLFVGGFGLATRAAARMRPWRGGQRYRALAAITCALVGTTWLVVGAAEIAWVWLVPAAVITGATIKLSPSKY